MVSSVSMPSIERCMVCAIGCLECRVFFVCLLSFDDVWTSCLSCFSGYDRTLCVLTFHTKMYGMHVFVCVSMMLIEVGGL